MKKLYLLALVLLTGIAAQAQTTVSRTTTIYAGTSPFQDSMWTFKSTDYSIVRRLAPSLSGSTITGVTGLATDPTTGIHYAILKVSGVSGRVLATMNVQTGVCTSIGNLGANFSTLAFNENGTLWGVTGDGASPSEVMFWIDKATADTTRFRALGAGADGEIITFCPDNHKFYHWSGNGTVVWERFDTTGTDVIESLTYSGSPGGETFGGIYIGGGQFLMSNISSQFKMWDTSGNIGSSLSSNPDDIRGMVRESHTSSITASTTSICPGNSMTFTITGGTGNYQWYMNGSAISGATTSTYMASAAGLYNAVYADANGIIDSPSAGITISLLPLPAVYNVFGGGSYCAGGTGVSIMLDSSNAGFRYQLYYGLGTLGSLVDGIEDTISFGLHTGAGSYTIEAIDTLTGCINYMAGSVSVTITPTVTPTVSVWQSTMDTVCQGTAIEFYTSITNGGSNPTYIWKVNGSTSGIDSVGFGHTPGIGVSKVSVILVSNAVCAIPDTVMSDTLTTTIWENGLPIITLSASPNDTVCEGTAITVNPTIIRGGYGPTFVWVKNASVVGTSSTYTYTPIDGDNIYAVMTSNYMCRDTDVAYSNVVDMTVVDPVVPSVTISAKPGVNVFGVADTFTATVMNGGTNPSYQWYFNGTIVAGATNNTYIRSSVAHQDSITVKVTRNDACGLYTVNSVRINGRLGVQTLAGGSNISLIPNPNNGNFSVKGTLGLVADEEVNIEITNMLGQEVYSNKFRTEQREINAQVHTTNLANGSYILNLRSSNGNNVFHFVVAQ